MEAIANTTQVVWANSKKQEGLTGRSDIKLQTAVGMPVAVDSKGNMCVVVMFSPHNILSTDDAMEYLQSLSLSATSSSIPCLLPVTDPSLNGGNGKLLMHPHHHSQQNMSSPDVLGEGVAARFVSLDEHGRQQSGDFRSRELTTAPKDTFGIPMLPSYAEIGNTTMDENIDIFDEASYGIWNAVMGSLQEDDVYGENENPNGQSATVQYDPSMQVVLLEQISMSEARRIRLEEFLSAFLDMSVFDLADVWVPAGDDYPDCLRLVTAVTSTETNLLLNSFKLESENTLIKFWAGAVGRAYSSGNPVWSANPNVFVDPGRAAAFQRTKIQTVLAVPVFSGKDGLPKCVVSCYSLVRSGSVPFVLKFVQQALRLLWEGLDKIRPHATAEENFWHDVAPADLGEMAADTEMQQHFMIKKRPFNVMAERVPSAPVTADKETDELASLFQTITLPNGDIVTIPLQLPLDGSGSEPGSDHASSLVNVADVQNHIFEAVRSVAAAVPFSDHFSTNSEGTKRAHIMGPLDRKDHHPLPMPHKFPSMIVGASPPSPGSSNHGMSMNNYQAGFSPQQHSVQMPHSMPMSTANAPYQNFHGSTLGQVNVASFNSAGVNSQFSAPSGISMPRTLSPSQFCVPVSDSIQTSSGSPKICRIQGCDEQAVARRPYCIKHSGNRLCEQAGCGKCAQGSTRFCIAHGGGRRCTYPGCDKGARDKFFCAAHGGGKRCSYDGCSKSAVGGSNLCTAHGGGRRCCIEGCDKSAQSSTKYCVKHGGGKKCANPECEKVARGRTLFCAAHGGGVRCKLDGCNRVAIGKMQLCRAHGGYSSRSRSNRNAPSPVENASMADSPPQTGIGMPFYDNGAQSLSV